MDNRNHGISELIELARQEYLRLREYILYTPIHNSKLMLDEISDYLTNRIILLDVDLQRWNVGLLAAKALDFDNRFTAYALSLHNVWGGFLAFLNTPRAP